jgi:hypothetical protein
MAIETKVEVEGAGRFSILASLVLSVLALSPVGPFGHFRAKATDTETGEIAFGYGQTAKAAETEATNRLGTISLSRP